MAKIPDSTKWWIGLLLSVVGLTVGSVSWAHGIKDAQDIKVDRKIEYHRDFESHKNHPSLDNFNNMQRVVDEIKTDQKKMQTVIDKQTELLIDINAKLRNR